MMATPFWGNGQESGPKFSPHPWDGGWIAGRPLPGVTRVKGGGIVELKIDEKKAPGRDGSRITGTGLSPKEFAFECKIWTPEHLAEMDAIIDHVWRRPDKKTRLSDLALTVYHPALPRDVRAAVVKGVSPYEDGPEQGTKLVRFTMLESQLPGKKPATKTAKGSSVGVAPQLRKGEEPKNATPPKPSANAAKNFTPAGPPFTPASGAV